LGSSSVPKKPKAGISEIPRSKEMGFENGVAKQKEKKIR